MRHLQHLLVLPLLVFCLGSVWGQQEPPKSTVSTPNQAILDLIRSKKWQEAMDMVEPMAKMSPDSEQVLLFQVAIYQGMERHEECQQKALTYLAKYESGSTRDQILYLFATSLYQTGKKWEAIDYLEKADKCTKDSTLKKNIAFFLPRWRAEVNHIGIHLGGKPPATPEEEQIAKTFGLKVLKMALEDYHQVNGKYPERLDKLLEGTPPFIKFFPEDPANPGMTFEYIQEGEGYRFPAE